MPEPDPNRKIPVLVCQNRTEPEFPVRFGSVSGFYKKLKLKKKKFMQKKLLFIHAKKKYFVN